MQIKISTLLIYTAFLILICTVTAIIISSIKKNKKKQKRKVIKMINRIKIMSPNRTRSSPIAEKSIVQEVMKEVDEDISDHGSYPKDSAITDSGLPVNAAVSGQFDNVSTVSDDSLDLKNVPSPIYVPSQTDISHLKESQNEMDPVEQASGQGWHQILISEAAVQEFQSLKPVQDEDNCDHKSLDLDNAPHKVFTASDDAQCVANDRNNIGSSEVVAGVWKVISE